MTAAAQLHTLTESCWCDPVSALDGHVNEDGTQPEFAATDLDPVDEHGFLIEGPAPAREMTDAELDAWLKKANDDLIAAKLTDYGYAPPILIVALCLLVGLVRVSWRAHDRWARDYLAWFNAAEVGRWAAWHREHVLYLARKAAV